MHFFILSLLCGPVFAGSEPDASAFRRAVADGDARATKLASRHILRDGDVAVPAVATLLDDPDSRVRTAAADLLARMKTDRALEAVVPYAMNHVSDPIHGIMGFGDGRRILLAIGPRAIPFVTKSFRLNQDSNTRLVNVYVNLRSPAAEPLFKAALKDGSTSTVQAAAYGLGYCHCPSALPLLLELLQSPDPYRRFGAITGLTNLGDPAAVPNLARVLEAPDAAADFMMDNPPPRGEHPMTLHRAASGAIDSLTHRAFKGDVKAIRAWLAMRRDAGTP